MSNTVTTATTGIDISRQLEAAFALYVKDISPLITTLLANGSAKRGKNTTYEWYEYTMSRIETTVTSWAASGYFDSTEKDLVLWDTSNLQPKDILRFETSDGVAVSNLSVYVTQIVDGTTVKVIKLWGTDAVVDAANKAVLVSSSNEENSKKGNARKIQTPLTKYNYFQIIDAVFENSRTIEWTDIAGDIGKIADLRRNAFYNIQRQLTEIVANGTRAKFNDPVDGKEVRSCWGLSEFIVNTQDGEGNSVSQTTLDKAVETIVKWGWRANTIRVNTKQAMKISSIDNSKINVNLTDQVRGNVVTAIQSSIPVEGSRIERIIVDTTMPEDVIEVFDINNLALVPFVNGWIRELDATEPWQDGTSIRTLWEYTLEAKNMEQTAVRITNLAID